jgi:hypothetical protein
LKDDRIPSAAAWESFYNGPTYQGLKSIRDACSSARLDSVIRRESRRPYHSHPGSDDVEHVASRDRMSCQVAEAGESLRRSGREGIQPIVIAGPHSGWSCGIATSLGRSWVGTLARLP